MPRQKTGGKPLTSSEQPTRQPLLLIELSTEPIAYAEEDSSVILHYSQDDKLVLVEVIDFRHLLSEETVTELLAS